MSSHPYYPRHLILTDYEPNQRSMLYLLKVVGGLLGSIALGTLYAASRKNRPGAFYFVWFMICGLLHCCFESYWLWHHNDITSRTDLFAELWKEYAHGDSRYLTSDPLVMTLETITVVRNTSRLHAMTHLCLFFVLVRMGSSLFLVSVGVVAELGEPPFVPTSGVRGSSIQLQPLLYPGFPRLCKLRSSCVLFLDLLCRLQCTMDSRPRHRDLSKWPPHLASLGSTYLHHQEESLRDTVVMPVSSSLVSYL